MEIRIFGAKLLAEQLFYTNKWICGRGPHEACIPFWTFSSILQGMSVTADCLNGSSGVHSNTAPQRKHHLIWPSLGVNQAPCLVRWQYSLQLFPFFSIWEPCEDIFCLFSRSSQKTLCWKLKLDLILLWTLAYERCNSQDSCALWYINSCDMYQLLCDAI